MIKKTNTLVTHSGSFHADDIFACATLQIFLDQRDENYEIRRTRDPEIIEQADYVFDVGGIYDPERRRFDHHQKSGAGMRDNGIPYASFGLVWKTYGAKVCHSEEIADYIDKRLVQPIDATDSGVDLVQPIGEVTPYTLQDYIASFRPNWDEDQSLFDTRFELLVQVAQQLLVREIISAQSYQRAEEAVERAYRDAEDKRILVLESKYPFQTALNEYSEPIFVIYPEPETSQWRIKAVKKEPFSFENRKDFPKEWAGLQGQELATVTGVPDAIFCHNAQFLCVAGSKEGAQKLAEIACEA